MVSKIYYEIVFTLILITLLACELFEQGYGDKVDLKAPTVSISSPANGEYVTGLFVLKGLATDDTNIKNVVVKYISNVTQEEQTLIASLSESNWHVNIDSTDDMLINDGSIKFVVTATDSADKTTKEAITLNIDNTAPTVLVSSPTNEEKNSVNGIINIKGTVEENIKLKEIRVSIVSSTDNSRKFSVTTSGADWTASINSLTNSIGINNPEIFNIDVEAEDFAGNINSFYYYKSDLTTEEVKNSLNISMVSVQPLADPKNKDKLVSLRHNIDSNPIFLTIDQKQDTPKITLSGWDLVQENNYKAFSSDVLLAGNVRDDDGIDEIVLSVYNGNNDTLIRKGVLNAGESTSVVLNGIKLEASSWEGFEIVEGSENPELAEGLYYFTIDVSDIEGKASGQVSLENPAIFGIDKTYPEISITSPEQDAYYKSSFDIIGTATDAVNVDRVELQINDGDIQLANLIGNNWSYTLDTTNILGRVTIKAIATDGSGKASSDSVVVSIDKTKPEIKDIRIPTSINGTITISGRAVDNRLKSVEYNLDDGGWTSATVDGDAWSFDIDTTNYYPDPVAINSISLAIKGTDESGNVSDPILAPYNTLDINEASDKPVISFKSPDPSKSVNSFKGSVTFWAEITDDDAVDTDSIELFIYDIDNTQAITVDPSKYIIEDNGIITFKYTPSELPDGHYSVSLSVKDKLDGRTGIGGDIVPILFTTDKDGPVIVVDDLGFNVPVYKNSDFPISGVVTDTMGGVESLSVKLGDDTYNVNIESDGSWSQVVSTSFVPNGAEDSKTISIEALDFAGNINGVIFDTNGETFNGSITIDKIDPVENSLSSIIDLNGIVKISGEESDSYLDSVEVKIGTGDWDLTTGVPYSWNYIFDTRGVSTGTSIYVRGIDKAGNNIATEYTLGIDQSTDYPEISFDNSVIVAGAALDNTFMQNSTLGGIVTDDDGVLSGSINIKFYSGATLVKTIPVTETVNNGKRIDWTIDLTDVTDGNPQLAEGVYTFEAVASDDISKKLSIGATLDEIKLTTTDRINMVVDNGPPTLTETALGTSDLLYKNSDITLSGIATDGTTVTHVVVSYTKDSGLLTEILDDTTDDGIWEVGLPIATGDGFYDISIVATDVSGGTTTISRKIQIDTAAPELIVTKPVLEESTGLQNYEIKGTSRDLGIGFDGTLDVEYKLDSGVWTNLPLTGIDWSKTLDLGTTEGSVTLNFRSTDKLGNVVTLGERTLYLDKNPPELTETNVPNSDNVYVNSDKIYTGVVSDTNAISTLGVSLNGGTSFTDISGNITGTTWTYTFAADTNGIDGLTVADEGTFNLIFRATDIAGKTTDVTRTVTVDVTKPLSAITTDFTSWQGTDVVAIEGSASDSSSGLKLIQYKVNTGSWVNLSTDSTWSGFATIPVGEANTLYVQSTDNAGNVSIVAEKTVKVDTSNPSSIVVQSPANLVKLNGQSNLEVSVDATDIGSGITTAKLKIGSTDFSSPEATGALNTGNSNNGNWNFIVPAANILALSDRNDINIEFTDGTGHSAIKSFQIYVDKTPPSIPEIMVYSDNDLVNKTISISGTASDTQGLASVDLEIYNSDTTSWDSLSGSISGTYSWSIPALNTETYDSSTYDINAAAGNQIKLRIISTDEALNTSNKELILDIDQNSDRPIVKLNNIDAAISDTLKLSHTIYGSVTDDDGPITTFEISQDGTVYTTVTTSGESWDYDVTGDDGAKTLYFRVTDSPGTQFTTILGTQSSAFTEPRIWLTSAPTYSNDIVNLKIDTVTPEIGSTITADRLTPFDFAVDSDTQVVTTNMAFGGASKEFVIKVLAKDANGIDSIVVNVPGVGNVATVHYGEEDGYEVYNTSIIDVTGLNGSANMVITVTDNSGLSSTASRTILLDNIAPEISHNSPINNSEIVNGEIEVKGLSSDSGSGLFTVKYKVGYNSVFETWTAVSGTAFNWSIPFTGQNKIDLYAGLLVEDINTSTDILTLTDNGYTNGTKVWVDAAVLPTEIDSSVTYYIINATTNTFQLSESQGGGAIDFSDTGSEMRISKYGKDTDNDLIWEVPVLVKAVDSAGNINEEDESSYIIKVDPSGDRPNISIVYPDPNETNRVMGGIIRVFGTAEDDDAVGAVYMQVDTDGNGIYDANDDSIDTWYNGGAGKVVDGTSSWNMSLNSSGEFNPSGEGINPINFRVRVKDINDVYGPWSASQHIDVDNKVPKIGSFEAPALSKDGGATVQPYISDMWIKDDWILTGTIEDESGISDIQITGDITGSLSGNSSWFTSYDNGDGKTNYRMAIPVNTVSDSSGLINFTVEATDNSVPQTSSSMSFSINYDNKTPTLSSYEGATPVEQNNYTYELSSKVTEDGSGLERVAYYFLRQGATDAADRVYNPMEDKAADNNKTLLTAVPLVDGLPRLALTTEVTRPNVYSLTHTLLVDNLNVRKGGLIKIGGLDRLITDFNSTTGTVTWAESINVSVTEAWIAYALVVDNDKIETPEDWNSTKGYYDTILNDDGDGVIEAIERTGGSYQWFSSINSHNIPDGPIDINWVAYDKSGNYTEGTISTQVLNNRPKLVKLRLGTDLNGINGIEASELSDFYDLEVNNEAQSVATASTGSYIAKGDTSVEMEIIGGNGELKYILTNTTGSTPGGHDLVTLTKNGSGYYPVNLSVANLTTIGEDAKILDIKIWDSTEETIIGSTSQWADLTLPITVDVIDGVKPVVIISPFFWTSETENSLYDNSRDNGHIELDGVAVLDADLDPSVSGQISFRGTAYDDQRIDKLYMRIDDMTMSGTTGTYNSENYTLVATYNGDTWTPVDNWTAEGWKFTVNSSLDQAGHHVNWQLDWDTSKVSNVAALNKIIKIVAIDKGLNENIYTVTADNVPFKSVDVVPYITSLTTPDRTNSGLKDQNIRSANGKYSIITGSDSSFITLAGFNLNPTAVRIVNEASINGTVTASTGTGVSYANVASDYTSLTLSNASTVSGFVELFTNGVRSINNINDNNAEGSIGGYNNEQDLYVSKNKTLTDDRFIRFFTMKDTGVKNGYNIDMLMNGNNPVFSYLNLNGGPSTAVGTGAGTGAGSTYPANAMPQRAEFLGTDGSEVYTEYLIKGLIWDQMSMARDEGGRFYHLSSYNYNGDRMSMIYDRYAELYSDGEGWGTQTRYSNYSGDYSHNNDNNAITLEATNFGEGLLLGRYQYPKIIARGNSTSGDASVYMLYYDDNTTGKNLIFRNFKIGTTTMDNQLFSGGVSSTSDAYAQYANLPDYNTTGRLTAAANASKYFDFGITSDNYVVIVYYDESAGRLKLRYSDSAVDGSNPTTAITWTDSPVSLPNYVGNYVSMAIDSNNDIHISSYDSSDSDLSYIFIDDYTGSTYSAVTVDASFSVGTWSNIKIKEVSTVITPYIAYCNSSEYGGKDVIKLAYPNSGITSANVPSGVDTDGYTTGDWEYMNIPSLTSPQAGDLKFKHVNLDFDSSGRPVIGYLGTNIEFGSWLEEE